MTTLSETIALHIEELSYADLPLTVSDKVKLSILDLLGAAMNGSKTKESEYLVKAIGKMGSCGKRGANIWGWKTKASLPMAALANGTSAHAREMDDWGCGLHPGAALLRAAGAPRRALDH